MRELADELDGLDGTDDARQQVREHLGQPTAVVGFQILMSCYDESVAATNVVIDFLEQLPGVLTQVDTVGW
ncbi:hypothetical protein [Paraconexibacter sp. AEG42_29]|uniref:hypothetical protein n=1 Tax=Paraconexibacter sp. AEG42_29 TaxID=2997339 RepID=UPI00339D3363